MWNRRKDEVPLPSRQSTAPPSPSELAREGIPMSTLPARGFDQLDSSSRATAAIGKSVVVKGNIFSREDLIVDGEVDGSIEMLEHRLTVGPNGSLKAIVKAREIIVVGTIHGNVEATDKIEIRKEAKLVGDIKTQRIVIEDGAYFKGSIDIIRPEVTKPVAKAAAVGQGAAAGPNATPAMQQPLTLKP